MTDAAALYEQMEATEDAGEKVQLLRQIELFWPEYRDIQERLAALATDV